jgi:hypothetical protein
MQSSLHLLAAADPAAGAAPLNKHTVFVDTPDEAAAFDAAAYFDTDPALVGRTFNRPRKATLAEQTLGGTGGGAGDAGENKRKRKRASRDVERSYAELEARMERSGKMARLGEHMDLQRALLQKGRRVKVADAEGDRPAVFKWKTQRKK